MTYNTNEFIYRMEKCYSVSDDFRDKMRLAVAKIESMDVTPVTRMILLKKVEETYLIHSENSANINQIKKDFNKNVQILTNNLKDKVINYSNSEIAEISSDSNLFNKKEEKKDDRITPFKSNFNIDLD